MDFFTVKENIPYSPPVHNQSDYGDSNYYEPADLPLKIDPAVVQALWKAVYARGAQKQMKGLRMAMKDWMPTLYDFYPEEEEQDVSAAASEA